MSTVMNHLARRGVQAHAHLSQKYAGSMEQIKVHVPTWGVILVVVTTVIYLFASFAIEYTFNKLIPALVMVETPQAILFEPVNSTDDVDFPIDNKDSKEPELLLVKQEPITASFRSTIKHLKSVGGFGARFRGAGLFVVYCLVAAWVSQWVAFFLPFFPIGFSDIVAAVILANLSLTWTHIVISGPSDKAWYRRVPSFQVWKKIALPTFAFAAVEQIAVLLPVGLLVFFGLADISPEDKKNFSAFERRMVVLKSLSVVLLTLVMLIFVAIPAKVAMTRVQASLLAEDQETIVPCDTTFGGHIDPETVGKTGIRGLFKVWRTVDRASRVRLFKTYIKAFAIQVALTMAFFLVIAGEVLLMFGPSKLMEIGQGNAKPVVDDFHTLPAN